MKAPSKKSGLISALIWIISFGLAFLIPPPSILICLPDALLLIGFFPLLLSVRSPWLWFIFGVIDAFIGIILLIFLSSPQEELIRLHIFEANRHMQSYHPYYVWVIIGMLSATIGIWQLLYKLSKWLLFRFKRNNQSN
jgi:hypothetical protein